MPPRAATYSSALARAKLAFTRAHGLDDAEVLGLLQATPQEVADPDARLPVGPAMAFWAHLMHRLDDAGVPVRFAALLSASDFGVLGFASLTAATSREAMHRAARYYAVLSSTAGLKVVETGAVIRVELQRPGERTLAMRVMNENTIACILQVIRSVTRVRVRPLSVAFRHRAPADLRAHEAFFDAPLRFESDWDGLVLPPDALERPPPSPDAAMTSYFERHARRVLAELQKGETLTDRVCAAIAQSLTDGAPSMAGVARRLGTSERSLRRALAAEAGSFRDLVERVRRDLATEYLSGSRASLTEIAYLLGFSEPSAFSRAYRRWFGAAPRERRR